MAVNVYAIAADTDDGYRAGASTFSSTDGPRLGSIGIPTSLEYSAWLRFTNVTQAASATPSDAAIFLAGSHDGPSWYVHGGAGKSRDAKYPFTIYALAEDNSAAPGNAAAWDTDHGLHTTAYTRDVLYNCEPNNYGGVDILGFVTESVASQVTEVAARGGWASGQAMQFHLDCLPDTNDETMLRYWEAIDYAASAIRMPSLFIADSGEIWPRPIGEIVRYNSRSTTYALDLPYPRGMKIGETIIAAVGVDNDATFSWPAGWTELTDEARSTTAGLSLGWHKVTGSEPATFRVTFSKSAYVDAICFRVTRAIDPATQPPEAASASGTDTTPDPPTVNPTGGSKKYGVLTVTAVDYGRTVSAYPYSFMCAYGSSYYNYSWSITIALSWGFVESDSINPGTFTINASDEWVAATVVFHPVASVPTYYEATKDGVWGVAG